MIFLWKDGLMVRNKVDNHKQIHTSTPFKRQIDFKNEK